MKIGVVAKTHRQDFADQLKSTLLWLRSRGCDLFVEKEVVEKFGIQGFVGFDRESIPELSQVMIVFGGDGTLLAAARLVKHHRARILGVNLGSLGFLTEVTLKDLTPTLEQLLAGQYRISRRRLLEVNVTEPEGDTQSFLALNDAVINKGTLARIISMEAYYGSDFIANFLADGMIVATPTGSTAYSLSAGGPIIFPTEKLISLTPICPHTLTNRPLILPGDQEVRVVLRSGDDVMVTVDGQVGVELREGGSLTCTMADHPIELIQPSQKNFFDILREKLKWGER